MTELKEIYMLVWMDGGVESPRPHVNFYDTVKEVNEAVNQIDTNSLETRVLLIKG